MLRRYCSEIKACTALICCGMLEGKQHTQSHIAVTVLTSWPCGEFLLPHSQKSLGLDRRYIIYSFIPLVRGPQQRRLHISSDDWHIMPGHEHPLRTETGCATFPTNSSFIKPFRKRHPSLFSTEKNKMFIRFIG